jgi:hypothetical protein
MPSLPAFDIRTRANHSPQVVILGAGASLAAFPRGDRNGRRLPLMRDLVKTVGLEGELVSAGILLGQDEGFEELYDRISLDHRLDGVRRLLEDRIHKYFAAMRLPEAVTLYDRLLLTLRPKDLIATFNWDPFLLQAYARCREVRDLPRIAFLHGNVYLGFCGDCRVKGYATQKCSRCGNWLTPSPLLYPVRNKEYRNHPMLAEEWSELERTLEHAYIVTIFGYSAPVSDAAAREILLKAWGTNEVRELAQIELIDILPERTLLARWADFIVRQHFGTHKSVGRTWQMQYPRRACEALAWATLQLQPWASRRLPSFRRLDRLREWLQPLVDEERRLDASGEPLSNWG